MSEREWLSTHWGRLGSPVGRAPPARMTLMRGSERTKPHHLYLFAGRRIGAFTLGFTPQLFGFGWLLKKKTTTKLLHNYSVLSQPGNWCWHHHCLFRFYQFYMLCVCVCMCIPCSCITWVDECDSRPGLDIEQFSTVSCAILFIATVTSLLPCFPKPQQPLICSQSV